jgi:hypothetical protein
MFITNVFVKRELVVPFESHTKGRFKRKPWFPLQN